MIKFFFTLVFLYNTTHVYQYVHDKYSFQYEDWLINYSGGFVRRGFFGEFAIKIAKFFSLDIQVVIFLFLILLLALFYFKSYEIIKSLKSNLFIYLMIFSPLFYTFFLVNHGAGIRKEFILFTFFAYLVSQKRSNPQNDKMWLFSLFFPLMILIYEPIIFYLPYFILFYFMIINNTNKKIYLFQVAITLTLSIIFALSSFKFHGTTEHVQQICLSLEDNVKEICTLHGAIYELGQSLNLELKDTIKQINIYSLFQWLLIILYSYIPIFLIFKNSKSVKKNYRKIFALLLIFNFLLTMPLFIIAHDWGRWFSIHYHLTALLILYLIKNKIIEIEDYFKNLESLFKKTLVVILLVLYSSFFTPKVFNENDKKYFKSYNLNYLKINYSKILETITH